MKARRTIITAVTGAALLGLGFSAGTVPAQESQRRGPGPDTGEMLIKGLTETPGCLGVDAGRWQSGRQTIAAWFESKQAVKRWYYHDAHQGAMQSFTMEPGHETRPLQHVPDDTGPIMVLATLTPSAQPELEAVAMPISQISIELFSPLPGGAFIERRLAPETFKVPHMRDYTPKPEASN